MKTNVANLHNNVLMWSHDVKLFDYLFTNMADPANSQASIQIDRTG